MDLLREWRLHDPIRQIDNYTGEEYYEIPCKILNVEKSPIEFGDDKGLHRIVIRHLDVFDGAIVDSKGYMFNKTYQRMLDLGTSLPDLTYCKVKVKKGKLRFEVYKNSSYMRGLEKVLERRYLEANSLFDRPLSKDRSLEYWTNYTEFRIWAHVKTGVPEPDFFEFNPLRGNKEI